MGFEIGNKFHYQAMLENGQWMRQRNPFLIIQLDLLLRSAVGMAHVLRQGL